MKTENRMKRYVLIATLIILFLISVSLAFVTYRYYSIVVRGLLGLILLYQLLYNGGYSRFEVSIETLQIDPKKTKYFIAALFFPLISYWATAQIYETILFFWKR